MIPTQAAVDAVMSRNDAMDLAEVGMIAQAIADMGLKPFEEWLVDLSLGGGTDNEAKFAAIMRGIILRLDQTNA